MATVTDPGADALLVLDATGRILDADDGAVAFYGRSREALRALSVLDLRCPETRPIAAEQLRSCLQQGLAVFETLHVGRDGALLPVSVESRRAEDAGRSLIVSTIRSLEAPTVARASAWQPLPPWDDVLQLLRDPARLEALGHMLERRAQTIMAGPDAIPFWARTSDASREPRDTLEAGAQELRSGTEEAYRAFSDAAHVQGVLVTCGAGILAELFSLGDKARLDAWIDRLEAQQRDDVLPDLPATTALVTLAMSSALTFWKPNHAERARWRGRAEALAGRIEPSPKLAFLNVLAQEAVWAPHVLRGQVLLDTHAVSKSALLADASLALRWNLARARLALFAGRGEEAQVLARQGKQAARRCGNTELDPGLDGLCVAARLMQEDLAELPAALDALLDAGERPSPYLLAHVEHLRAVIAARAGDHVVAAAHAERSKESARRSGVASAIAFASAAVRITARLAGGGAKRDRPPLSPPSFMGTPWIWEVLAAAAAALRLGEDEWAAEALAAAGPVAREGGLFFMPWLNPSDLAGLVALCLDRGIVTDYAVEAARRLGLRAPSQAFRRADWPWQVRVRLLGSNEILRPEEDASRPAPARPRVPDLLRALILLGPGEVEEHRLAAALWPGKDGDSTRDALQTALYRLRKLLGTDALVRKDGRVSIDRSRCWIDLWALQEELCRGHGPGGELAPGQPEAVRDLYQGPISTTTVLGPLEMRVQEDLRRRLLGVLVPHLKQLQREHQTSETWSLLGWLAGDPALELEVGRALSSSSR